MKKFAMTYVVEGDVADIVVEAENEKLAVSRLEFDTGGDVIGVEEVLPTHFNGFRHLL